MKTKNMFEFVVLLCLNKLEFNLNFVSKTYYQLDDICDFCSKI